MFTDYEGFPFKKVVDQINEAVVDNKSNLKD